MHGTGIETWADNGSKFTGAFVDSKKHGKGRFDWADGSYYEGDFEDGVFHGEGEYYFPDQQKTYYGQFVKGIVSGKGKEVWADGREYVGDFANGKKEGQGTMTIPGSKQYSGEWLNNLKHGIGFEINLVGHTKRKGEWKKGKWFRWLSNTETITGSVKTTAQFEHKAGQELQEQMKADGKNKIQQEAVQDDEL